MAFLPDQNRLTTLVVTDIINCNKKFSSKEGEKEKFTIVFEQGYKAEYCPLVGKFDTELIRPNQRTTFKVVIRKQFGDEIEPVRMDTDIRDVANNSPKRIITMQGHPATIAIMAAKDIHIKRLEYNMELNTADFFELSDSIYDYLITKMEG